MDLNPYMDLLEPLYDVPGSWRWLHTGQELLGGAVPVDLIRNGQGQRVADVIRQAVDAVYI
jgi:hypothetical protein